MPEQVAVERTLTVNNMLGLHLRAAGKLAQLAGKFAANVWVKNDNVEVNGKSIMGILSLAAARGTILTIRCVGNDANTAMAAIEELFTLNFHEE